MSAQPEALRLADELDDIHTTHVARNAAAELRRLHAENAAIFAALALSCDEQRHELWESGGVAGCERARVAERQRDALLELVVEMDGHEGAEGWSEDLRVKINVAIKAVEETK